MLSSYITGFPASHVPYQRYPPCALFPIEASTIRRATGLYRNHSWMVFQQPNDPVCLGMDVCLLSEGHNGLPIIGTVISLHAVLGDWSVYKVLRHTTSSTTFLLYVPIVWADISSYIPHTSQVIEWLRFYRLAGVTPGALERLLRKACTIRSTPVAISLHRRSSETITPHTVGFHAA